MRLTCGYCAAFQPDGDEGICSEDSLPAFERDVACELFIPRDSYAFEPLMGKPRPKKERKVAK